MTVEPNDDRANYKQLADLLRDQIRGGELTPGQRVRAERDYEQEHGISRDTVRKAIDILRHEGLLVTDRRGSHVRDRMDLTAVRVERGSRSSRVCRPSKNAVSPASKV